MNNQDSSGVRSWPTRLYLLDFARAVGSFSVIIWHWQHFAYEGTALAPGFVRSTQPLYDILKLFYEHGSAGVKFFFTISGFVFFWLYKESIANGTTSVKQYFVSRFSRLYPLHFVTLLLVAGLQHIYWQKKHEYFLYPLNDLYHFFLNLFFVSGWGFEKGWSFNAPIWSVSIEILLYAIFFILAYTRKMGLYTCVSIAVFSFIIRAFFYHPVFVGLTSFYVGAAVFQLMKSVNLKSPLFKKFICIMSVCLWLVVIFDVYAFNFSNSILQIQVLGKAILNAFAVFLLFPFTICALVLVEIEPRFNSDQSSALKLFGWIGNLTYSTYLIHFPLELIVGIGIAFGLVDKEFYLHASSLLWFLGILLIISSLSYMFFELKFQHEIRNRFAKKALQVE